MLTAAVLLIIGATGWALGRVRPQVNVAMAVMAVFGAITAHSGLQWAFVDGRLHDALGDPRGAAPGVIVVLIAAGEALGLWLPILLIPWAQFAARVYGAIYALAAATAGEHRYTSAFGLPIRPLKLRFVVESATSPVPSAP